MVADCFYAMETQIFSGTALGNDGMLWAFGAFAVLLCLIVLSVVRASRRAQREIDNESQKVLQRFSSFSPKTFTFYNRSYLVMAFEHFQMIVTWFFETGPVRKGKPFGLLHVKIPHTNGIRMYATTGLHTANVVAAIAGWHCLENGICLGKMLKTTREESEAIAKHISPEVAQLMSDTKRFPYGVSIISNLHERMVGKDAALLMADGDVSRSNDLDLQIRFSLDPSADATLELVKNAVDLAGRLEKDLGVLSY